MEGGLFLVFIIIALIARAIEAMTKGKQEPPQGRPQGRPLPQPRPRQQPLPRSPRPEYDRPPGTSQRPLPQGSRPAPTDEVPPDATEDAAAAMIPDDLWEILTGRPKPRPQQVPAPRPAPQPQPASSYEEYVGVEADVDEELGAYEVIPDELGEYDRRRRLEEAQRQLERQQLRERRLRERNMYTADKAPKVYSLERPLPPAVQRHAEFHARVDEVPVVTGTTRRRPAREWLFQAGDMKRAIVLQEVLGRPKGLE